eukprot:GGOE01046760.1.p6 GENE.GGOE01046760.1~~GGOE01046760.1.p6  ORF type:complete len:103 (+),score=2.30 GGOE01046760.1:1294-1602(+)
MDPGIEFDDKSSKVGCPSLSAFLAILGPPTFGGFIFRSIKKRSGSGSGPPTSGQWATILATIKPPAPLRLSRVPSPSPPSLAAVQLRSWVLGEGTCSGMPRP